MPTSAKASHGTLLKRGDGGSPENFATIAEVLDISGPALALGTEEATSHDSNFWREYVPTLLEGGEVSFDINYFEHTTQVNLRTDMLNRTRRNFQVVFPTSPAKTFSFAAYVTGFELSAPVEGKLTASVSLQISGPVTVS
jgi:predicted secreted protein